MECADSSTDTPSENSGQEFDEEDFEDFSKHYIEFREVDKRKSMEKSYKSAVVIIPPLSVCDQIQKIRAEHDKAYTRWMPHINLLYPFYGNLGSLFKQEAMKLTKHLSLIKPFEIEFTKDSIGCFVHGSRAVVWIKPLAVCPRKETLVKVEELAKKSEKKLKPKLETKSKCKSVVSKPMPTKQQIKPINEPVEQPAKGNLPTAGMDALRYAIWTPENTRQEIQKQVMENEEPSISTLRNAFEGLDRVPNFAESAYNPRCLDFTQNKRYENSMPFSGSDTSTSESSADAGDSSSSFSESSSDNDEEVPSESLPPRPDGQHPNVMVLQEELEKRYPDLDDLSNRSESGFKPHLTLGQFSVSYGKSFIQRLKEEWKPVSFVCKEIYLISRNNQDPFKIIEKVPFSVIDIDQSC